MRSWLLSPLRSARPALSSAARTPSLQRIFARTRARAIAGRRNDVQGRCKRGCYAPALPGNPPPTPDRAAETGRPPSCPLPTKPLRPQPRRPSSVALRPSRVAKARREKPIGPEILALRSPACFAPRLMGRRRNGLKGLNPRPEMVWPGMPRPARSGTRARRGRRPNEFASRGTAIAESEASGDPEVAPRSFNRWISPTSRIGAKSLTWRMLNQRFRLKGLHYEE